MYYSFMRSHWCPKSEAYSRGDSLVTALEDGWVLDHVVRLEERRLRQSARYVVLYHFTLLWGSDMATMCVVATPFVARLVAEHNLETILMSTIDHPRVAVQPSFTQRTPRSSLGSRTTRPKSRA